MKPEHKKWAQIAIGVVLVLVLLLWAFSSRAQTPAAPPSCIPILGSDSPLQSKGWAGSSVLYGETSTTRWATWTCAKYDGKTPMQHVVLVGVKATTPMTTLAGRLTTVERDKSPMSALTALWKKYVITDLNAPVLTEGRVAAVKAANGRKFITDVNGDTGHHRLTEEIDPLKLMASAQTQEDTGVVEARMYAMNTTEFPRPPRPAALSWTKPTLVGK
jgi:hypothetical protein